jgi:hypothetical protein
MERKAFGREAEGVRVIIRYVRGLEGRPRAMQRREMRRNDRGLVVVVVVYGQLGKALINVDSLLFASQHAIPAWNAPSVFRIAAISRLRVRHPRFQEDRTFLFAIFPSTFLLLLTELSERTSAHLPAWTD